MRCLFTHVTRPIQFSLVVDEFGVKYVGKEHADYLIKTLERQYNKISVDWEGKLYCGITLEWNYDKRFLDISIPGANFIYVARHGNIEKPFVVIPLQGDTAV